MADSIRIEELKRRVQMDPASIAFAALAEEYRRAGQYEEAISTCRAGLQRHPAYLSARVTLGRSLLELGRFADAREELEHVLRVAPENLAAIRGLAEIHHRGGEGHDGAVPPQHPAPRPLTVARPAHAPGAATDDGSMTAPGDASAAEVPAAIPHPAPPLRAIRPVRLSAVTADDVSKAEPAPTIGLPTGLAAPAAPPAREQEPAREVPPAGTPRRIAIVPRVAAAPAPAPAAHPDESALPALETFLAAIVRARAGGVRRPSSGQ